MSIYTRLDRLAADVDKLNRQVKSVSNAPQSQRTSVEGGSIDFNDADGNLMAIMGGQPDGSNTIRHVNGPTPPIPAGLSAHVDGPIIQVSWDGTFEDDEDATFDWSHLEVVAVGPNSENMRGTISDVTGASVSLAATASGEWTVVARSVSRAEKRSLDGDAGTVEVKLVDIDGAIEDAIGSANGKNTVTYSETPPTPEDEGIVGDTWFVGSTIDSGDPEAPVLSWNIVAQYRHDGSSWVEVELSHEVIASLDLGKATVGELDGIRIMGKTIGAEQLRADFADFVVARGATLIAGNDRHRLDDSGYAIFDGNGDRRTFLSPDGSTFKGEVEAETLVVNNGAELRGTTNVLAQGSHLTLAAGVTDPTAPPVVQPFWDRLEFEPVFMNGSDPVGLAWDGTNYITVGSNKAPSGVAAYYRGVFAAKINGTTGESSPFRCDFSAASGSESHVSEVFGVTCIGSELFWLGRYGYVGYVWVTDLNGVFNRRFRYDDMGYATDNPLVYKPGIGTDGTNVLIAHCSDVGTLYLRTYDPPTGAKTESTELTGFNNDVSGAYRGEADFGLARTVVSRPVGWQLRVGGTDLTYDGDRGWNPPTGQTVAGFCWTGGQFASIDSDGAITLYEDTTMGDNSGDWWGVYRWAADETPETPAITHSSRISPPRRFTWPQRAKVKFLGAPLPDGVDFIGPSVAKKATTPTRTDFHSPNWQIRPGESVAWYDEFPVSWESASTPSDSNNFPNAETAVIESASATFRVEGDGSGQWGPLTFGADGSLSGMRRMAAGRVTIAVTDQQKGYETATVNFPTGRFTSPPAVTVGANSTTTALINVGALSVTAEQATIAVRRTTTTATIVDWIATEID